MTQRTNCNGIVSVKGYMRAGHPVEAYNRSCGQHSSVKKSFANWHKKETEQNEGWSPASTEDNQENNENDENKDFENDKSGEENIDDESKNNSTTENEDNKNILLEAAFNFIKDGEGSVSGIYADVNGNLTVGYGTNVNDWSNFAKVEFRDPISQGHILSVGEKVALFDKAQTEKMNVNWGSLPTKRDSQRSLKDLSFITKEEAIFQAKESINTSIKEVQGMADRSGVNFNTLPPSAKVGILDMHYNMGASAFNPSTFPNFFEALRDNDFKKVGIESHRIGGVSKDRNDKTREKFNEAHKEFEHHQKYGTWK